MRFGRSDALVTPARYRAVIRFSAFTVSLPEWSPEEAVESLAALGYEGIEWRVVDQIDASEPSFWFGNRCTLPLTSFVDDAPRIRKLCDDAGLAIPNVGGYATCHEPEDVATLMQGAARLGAPSIRVRLPEYDGSVPYLPVRDAARRAFDGIERLARRHGVRALVELHMQSPIASSSAAASFLADRDPAHVGVIYDPGNLVFEGYEHPRAAVEILGPWLQHVHLKNASWNHRGTRADGSEAWRAEFAPLRAGAVDVAAVFAALGAVEYDGWVSFEDFSTATPMPERTRDNLEYAREVLART
jgi:sugar phosphate isomerase/epimerase